MASLPTEDDSSLLWLFSQPFLLERNQSIQLILSPLLTFHISHDLQLLIDSGDTDALAALSDHTADTDGWDDEFLPGYASGASDDGDLF